jgi:signal transduction histidine kinase
MWNRMATPERKRWRRLVIDSLQWRIVLVMTMGVVCAQTLGTALWAHQLRERARTDALSEGKHMAMNAAGTIRFFQDLPPKYRPILIEQLRTMGGTRFFVNVNKAKIPVTPLRDNALVDFVAQAVRADLVSYLPPSQQPEVVFAWPEALQVADDGRTVQDLPEAWVEGTLLLGLRPAPVMVIQAEFEKGSWLYLAAPMPDPYFLDNSTPLTMDRVALQLVTLITVLLITVLLVRGLIQPLNRIAAAANAFRNDSVPKRLPEEGSRELRRTARAFNAMQARIQGYLRDRERLFLDISHGLKTPIMRLKLRAELLDDDALRDGLHEDLDDLDVMVKTALQSLKDTDIYENLTPVRLDLLLARLAKHPIVPGADIQLRCEPVSVRGKPLALERAFSNLMDNAVLYGERVEIDLRRQGGFAVVQIRDFGPGISVRDVGRVFNPHVRLEHGQIKNQGGSGLGLGIARNTIENLNGSLQLTNHAQGGLVVTIALDLYDENSKTAMSLSQQNRRVGHGIGPRRARGG